MTVYCCCEYRKETLRKHKYVATCKPGPFELQDKNRIIELEIKNIERLKFVNTTGKILTIWDSKHVTLNRAETAVDSQLTV